MMMVMMMTTMMMLMMVRTTTMMVPRYAKRSASRSLRLMKLCSAESAVQSAKCKVESAKWKVDAELLHCFIIAMNVMIMFKMINSY